MSTFWPCQTEQDRRRKYNRKEVETVCVSPGIPLLVLIGSAQTSKQDSASCWQHPPLSLLVKRKRNPKKIFVSSSAIKMKTSLVYFSSSSSSCVYSGLPSIQYIDIDEISHGPSPCLVMRRGSFIAVEWTMRPPIILAKGLRNRRTRWNDEEETTVIGSDEKMIFRWSDDDLLSSSLVSHFVIVRPVCVCILWSAIRSVSFGCVDDCVLSFRHIWL